MRPMLVPLVVLLSVTVAMIPVLLLSLLEPRRRHAGSEPRRRHAGSPGPRSAPPTGSSSPSEPIWRAWVEAEPSGAPRAAAQIRRSTRSDPHSPSSTNCLESSAARQMS
jgi:hypothetical protein